MYCSGAGLKGLLLCLTAHMLGGGYGLPDRQCSHPAHRRAMRRGSTLESLPGAACLKIRRHLCLATCVLRVPPVIDL